MAMPESIPAPLIIDTYKDIFRTERNGVRRRDPLVFVAVPLVLAVVTFAAVWLPARRASRVDPIIALRYE